MNVTLQRSRGTMFASIIFCGAIFLFCVYGFSQIGGR